MIRCLFSLLFLMVWVSGEVASSEPVTMVQVHELGDNLTAEARLFEAKLRGMEYDDMVQSVIQYLEEEMRSAWDEATRDPVNCPFSEDITPGVMARLTDAVVSFDKSRPTEEMTSTCQHVNEMSVYFIRLVSLRIMSKDRVHFLPRYLVNQAVVKCRPRRHSTQPCQQDPSEQMKWEFHNLKMHLANQYTDVRASVSAEAAMVLNNCTRPYFSDDNVRNLLQPFLQICNDTLSASLDPRLRPVQLTTTTEDPNRDDLHLLTRSNHHL